MHIIIHRRNDAIENRNFAEYHLHNKHHVCREMLISLHV